MTNYHDNEGESSPGYSGLDQDGRFRSSPRFGGQGFTKSPTDDHGGNMRTPRDTLTNLMQNRDFEVENLPSKEWALEEMQRCMTEEREANWSTIFPVLSFAR